MRKIYTVYNKIAIDLILYIIFKAFTDITVAPRVDS